jgi:hypothetical protein
MSDAATQLRDAVQFAASSLRQPQAKPEDVAEFLDKAVQDYDNEKGLE